jgi:hypothetical protein
MNPTLERLVRQLDARGLSVKAGAEPGQLLLCGPAAEKTPAVLDALKAFKPQLLELYGTKAQPDLPTEARGDAVAGAAPVPQ